MIDYIPSWVLYHCNRIRQFDPFQHTIPLWKDRSFLALLPESQFTPLEKTTMPVAIKAIANVPARKVFRNPAVPEINEVLEALKKMKPSDAIEVTLCKATEERYSKNREGKPTIPSKQLAASLKRKFVAEGLAYTCYASEGKVIVVKEK